MYSSLDNELKHSSNTAVTKIWHGPRHYWSPTKWGASSQRGGERQHKLMNPRSDVLRFPAGHLFAKAGGNVILLIIRKWLFWKVLRKGRRVGCFSAHTDNHIQAGFLPLKVNEGGEKWYLHPENILALQSAPRWANTYQLM